MSKLRAKSLKAFNLHLGDQDWGIFVQDSEWEGFRSLKKIDGSGQKVILANDPESSDNLFNKLFGEIFHDGEQEFRIIAGSPEIMHEIRSAQEKELPTNAALQVIGKERQRQIDGEGWTAEHDDQYNAAELCLAASCYALMVEGTSWRERYPAGKPPPDWPWDPAWWKPSTPEGNLSKAGALIVAEIERQNRRF